MKATRKSKTNINDYILCNYILPVVGPLIGVTLVTLPALHSMSFIDWILLVLGVYGCAIGFVIVVLILTGMVMLLMKIPVVSRILISDVAKKTDD